MQAFMWWQGPYPRCSSAVISETVPVRPGAAPMIFNVILYGLHLPVSNLARLTKDDQRTLCRASLRPATDNPDESWVSLSLAPVAAACIVDGITVAGREGRIVLNNGSTATLMGNPIFVRHPLFCAGVRNPVPDPNIDAAGAEPG